MTDTPTRFAYLHGFGSSARSRKGVHLREAFAGHGLDVVLPDLNRPSFAKLSTRAMLAYLDGLPREGGPWGFVGSSLGGWLAARWAQLRPERVGRLVLLCPAFDIATRWPAILGDGAFRRWREQGELEVPDGAGVPTPLHYAFFEESRADDPRPVVPCPTRIIHGTRDETVPVESSRAYAREHAHVELLEVDDAHDLWASRDLIVRESLRFLAGVDG
ncbi:MAG: YqiA/YcfP family alpha/beta fold hydrolase [Sandaracinaceae bacterium]